MIGGNVTALLQVKTTSKNSIGESKDSWAIVKNIVGFLDFMSGEAGYTSYNAKVEESTHVFICDYQLIEYEESEVRFVIDNKTYEITFIDDPMGLHKHLEFYLKYLGA